MRTTFDDIPELEVPRSAPSRSSRPPTSSRGRGPIYAVLYAAFRDALIDGREPHGVFLKLEEGTDVEPMLPPDAEVVRSAVDDDDTSLLARGLGLHGARVDERARSRSVSAISREQVKAVADGLRERAKAAATTHDTPPPGQYL